MSGVTITGGTPSTTEYTPSGSGVVNRGTLTLTDSSVSGNLEALIRTLTRNA